MEHFHFLTLDIINSNLNRSGTSKTLSLTQSRTTGTFLRQAYTCLEIRAFFINIPIYQHDKKWKQLTYTSG